MSVYTHVVYGDENFAIEALPIPQAKAETAEIVAAGTDNDKGGVQKGAQTAVFTRDKLSIVGNGQQNPHQIALNHNPFKTSLLGNKKKLAVCD